MSKSRKQDFFEESPRLAESEAQRRRRESQRQLDELRTRPLRELEDDWDEYSDIDRFEKIKRSRN